jgi:hypothetical protein
VGNLRYAERSATLVSTIGPAELTQDTVSAVPTSELRSRPRTGDMDPCDERPRCLDADQFLNSLPDFG